MVGLEKAARGIRARAEKESYSAMTTCPLEKDDSGMVIGIFHCG